MKQSSRDKALLLNVPCRPAQFGTKNATAAVVVSPYYQRVYVDSWKTKETLENFEKIPQDPLTKVPIIYIMGERKGNNTMTLARFINYINYSTVCPTDINPVRWTGMIRWAKVNGFIS